VRYFFFSGLLRNETAPFFASSWDVRRAREQAMAIPTMPSFLLSTHLEVHGPLFHMHVHKTRHGVAANVIARRRLYRHRAHILERGGRGWWEECGAVRADERGVNAW